MKSTSLTIPMLLILTGVVFQSCSETQFKSEGRQTAKRPSTAEQKGQKKQAANGDPISDVEPGGTQVDPQTKSVPSGSEPKVESDVNSGSGSTTAQTSNGGLDVGNGQTTAVTPVNYNLTVILGPAANKVTITRNNDSAQQCTETCTKTFQSGSVVKISVIANQAPEAATRTVKRWEGNGCQITGGSDGECSLTLTGHATVQPVFLDTGTYGTGGVNLSGVLRNSVGLRTHRGYQLPGLPTSSNICSDMNYCDAIFMFNDDLSKARACSGILPGSAAKAFLPGRPVYNGWADRNYSNLYIAKFNGSSWSLQCSGGPDCYNKAASLEYLGSLTCEKESL